MNRPSTLAEPPLPRPTALTDHARTGVLEVAWSDGLISRLPHALLRERCRCAGCEAQRRKGADIPPAAGDLRLVGIEPVGEQAVNLRFSDGHDRGIYPWAYLHQLSMEACA